MTIVRALFLAGLISFGLGCGGGSSSGDAKNLETMAQHKDAICNAKTAQDHEAAKKAYEDFQGQQSVVNWALTADGETKKKLQSISGRLLRCYNRSF